MWVKKWITFLDWCDGGGGGAAGGGRVSERVATQIPGREAQHILGGTKSQETTCNFGYLAFCKNTLIGGIFSPLESTFVSN